MLRANVTRTSLRAPRFTLLESTRRTTPRHVVLGAASVSAQLAMVVLLVATTSLLQDDVRSAQSAGPTFLAPFTRPASRAVQENITFLGLGTTPVAPVEHAPAATSAPPPVPEIVAGGDIPSLATIVAPEEPRVLSEVEVDSVAERDPTSEGPAYPPHLLAKNVQGAVLVQFVVDTTGRPDLASFRVIAATDTAFASAVRQSMLHMHFRPAKLQGRPVPQLVEQNFLFKISKPPSAADVPRTLYPGTIDNEIYPGVM